MANAPVPLAEDARGLIGRIADEYAAGYKAMFPGAEYFGQALPGGDALPDNSLAALAAWQRREDGWMSELLGIDGEALWGTPEWTVLGYLRTTLATCIAMRVCRTELWPAHQFGWQVSLLELLDIQLVGTAAAREQALARWSQLPRFLEIELVNLREGLRRGFRTEGERGAGRHPARGAAGGAVARVPLLESRSTSQG